MMKIEVSRIHKLDGTGATKAFADITIEDSINVLGLRIVEGKDGLVQPGAEHAREKIPLN